MTREEAITRIKDHIEVHRYHEQNAVKIFEALDMAIKSLEQPEQRWIPCSETEPKKSGYYLCTHSGTVIVSPDYYTTQEQAEEIFADPEDEYLDLKEYIGWASKDVIAWMPLPGPYREEGGK